MQSVGCVALRGSRRRSMRADAPIPGSAAIRRSSDARRSVPRGPDQVNRATARRRCGSITAAPSGHGDRRSSRRARRAALGEAARRRRDSASKKAVCRAFTAMMGVRASARARAARCIRGHALVDLVQHPVIDESERGVGADDRLALREAGERSSYRSAGAADASARGRGIREPARRRLAARRSPRRSSRARRRSRTSRTPRSRGTPSLGHLCGWA